MLLVNPYIDNKFSGFTEGWRLQMETSVAICFHFWTHSGPELFPR